MKVVTDFSGYNFKFPFEKYCTRILSCIPDNDLVGIREISFVENFSHPKSDKNSVANYLQGRDGKDAVIEIHVPNMIEQHVPEYLFETNHEIAGLLISEIIGHEIGHHVHKFKRHKVRKQQYESFAGQYARATYFQYLKSRTSKILSSYNWASLNPLLFNKEDRKVFSENRKNLVNWLKANKQGIEFP